MLTRKNRKNWHRHWNCLRILIHFVPENTVWPYIFTSKSGVSILVKYIKLSQKQTFAPWHTCLECAAAASFKGLRHTGHVAWSSSQGLIQSLWNICSHRSWLTDSSNVKSSQQTEHCTFWSAVYIGIKLNFVMAPHLLETKFK